MDIPLDKVKKFDTSAKLKKSDVFQP